jgi:diguanylate cyclase (GGDEF)-like protein
MARVLVVEDNPANMKLTTLLLRSAGHSVLRALDAESGLELARAERPDLILMDVQLPGMDGFAATAILKEDPATASIPIITLSALSMKSDEERGQDAGCDAYIVKPLRYNELYAVMEDLLQESATPTTRDDAPGPAREVTTPATVLIVDDESKNRRLLEVLLGPEGYATRTAGGGSGALASIADDPPDLILLDDRMPGLSGRQVAKVLKSDPATSNIPIIMVTVQTDREARLAALEAGAEDFMSKPVDRAELWLRVRNLLRLKEAGDVLENRRLNLETEVLARTADLRQLTHCDALTGLPNRTLVYETLTRTLVHASSVGQTVAVLFLDLDSFKNVNDTHGHALGDELLIQVSDRLMKCVRVRDTVGRLGGDEFALILMMPPDGQDAAVVAEKIQNVLLQPFCLDGHDVTVTASIGIALHPDDATDTDTLLKYADTAMYQAKQSGRDAFRFFTSAMNTELSRRLELEHALRAAVRNQEFVLHYQPKVDLAGGQVVGLEALLRWERPGFGLVPPGEFICALEDSGLIVEVGRWVIAAACEQVGRWIQLGMDPVQVSVNVSERQFVKGDLEGDVRRALETYGVPAELLELELTESLLMTNTDRTVAILENLKAAGVQISIDDFGTGYSSLAYLRRFPIDKLKIDYSFIQEITRSPDDAAIALAIIRMGHSLNLKVIAEGVETAGQLAFLRRHKCDQMQGYYFSRPLPVPALEQLLLADVGLWGADGMMAAPRRDIAAAG